MKKAVLKFFIFLLCGILSCWFYLLLKFRDSYILGQFMGDFSLYWAIFWMIILGALLFVTFKVIRFPISRVFAISFLLLIVLPLLYEILPSRINVTDEFVLFMVFSNDEEDGDYPDFYFCPIKCEGAKSIRVKKEIIFSEGRTKYAGTEYSYRLAKYCGYFEQTEKCCKGRSGIYIDTSSEILFYPKLLAEVIFSWLPALIFIFLILYTYEQLSDKEILKIELERDKILLGISTMVLGLIILYNFYYQDYIKGFY